MQERLDYVRYMQSQHFGPLNSDDQFRAIEGVIRFFINKGLGGPGTWVSYVDAGIVEGIQNGGAIALGKSSVTGGNPGSEKWAAFMRAMRDGSFVDRDVCSKTRCILKFERLMLTLSSRNRLTIRLGLCLNKAQQSME